MKPRKTALPVPEGLRFWSVDLGTEDEPNLHHFLMPRYTVAYGLMALATESWEAILDASIGGFAARALKVRKQAALIGACWHNRMAVLEVTEAPTLDPAQLAEFGEAVIEELQARYDIDQIEAMGEHCETEIRERLGLIEKAAKVAKDFTPAGDKAGPLQKEAAEPPSPEKSSI